MTSDYADSSFLMSLFMEDGNTNAAKRFISRNPAALALGPCMAWQCGTLCHHKPMLTLEKCGDFCCDFAFLT